MIPPASSATSLMAAATRSWPLIATRLAIVATIPAGINPDGIVFEPATQTVWAFNGRSKDATVIDATTQKVVATIPLPGKPEFPAVDGHGTVFDNIEDKSEIVRLDAHARKLTAEWPAGCQSPSGLAFDVSGHRLFTVCDGKKMAVVDSESGKVLATPAIGDGPDAARWDPKHQLAFASCGEGVLSVVDAVQTQLSHHREPAHPTRRAYHGLRPGDRPHLSGHSQLRPRSPGNSHQPAPPTRHAPRHLHRHRGRPLKQAPGAQCGQFLLQRTGYQVVIPSAYLHWTEKPCIRR